MKEKDEAFKIDHYLNLVLKRRWMIIIPYCLAMILGIYLAIALPRVYEASTLILIKPQQVPQDYVQSAIVAANIESRIMTISQKILSRANIQKIIDQFNLYVNPEQADMLIEEKIADLRERVLIELQIPEDTRREADVFSISFQWPEPQKVAAIANSLAALFINEDLKEREADAVDTTKFLDDQLRNIRVRLQEYETKLGDYRQRYIGELPEQLESNLRILDTLQQQLSEREERLRDEKNRLALLAIEIRAQKETLAGGAIVSEEGEAMTLPQLKNQLYTLQSSYTDRHPDIIRLKAQIADMEAKLKSGQLESSGGANVNTNLSEKNQLLTSDVLAEQIRQRREIKAEILNLNVDIRKLKNEIRIYQQRIERTPKREEELMALNRDYQNIQESYSSLLNRKLEADVAVNMEKRQKGEQFSILESAKVPLAPVSPNIKILFLLAVMGAFGIGFGLIFLTDYFDNSVKDPNDFEADLGVSLLATIPKVYRKKDLRLKRLNQLISGVFLVAAVLLFVGFAMLAVFGVEQTIEIVQNPSVLWATDNALSQ
jgi:polysaccharide chain length determinant protein (PEP-CTERM system associated)